MGQPFDFWNLPILLAAFNYEYRIHHAFEIPKESALTEERNTAAEELKSLFQEQQLYIRTARDSGKLTAEEDHDGNLIIKSPLSDKHKDEVARTLKDYTDRRERLKSWFTDAYHELQAYRETVRNELETVGDRYSTYFNKAPERLDYLISQTEDKGRRLTNILTNFKVFVRKFLEHGTADIKSDIESIYMTRHKYSYIFLEEACGRARFLGSSSYNRPEPNEDRIYWRATDWSRINGKLQEFRDNINVKLEEIRKKKDYTESEMEMYSFYVGVVDTKFKILDGIYNVIPPNIYHGRGFNFNEPLSVAGSVTTEEQGWFQNRIGQLKSKMEQQRERLTHIVDVEYRRLSDRIEAIGNNIPRPRGNQGGFRVVKQPDLAAACLQHDLL